jgi:hypothetical protein
MNERTDTTGAGFIKLKRSPETLELLKDRNAFILLTVIALRARRTSEFNVHRLRRRQAFLGDCRSYGLTTQQYRSAKRRLSEWSLASFRSTNRGTVATLLNAKIYDINETRDAQAANNHAGMTFDQMDRAKAAEALTQAGRRFLTDGQD